MANSVSAHTFYVDPEHTNASDENNGTETSPWKTLGRACKQADNGDIVLVKAGIYNETLRPIRDGVTFAAYGNDSVILTISNYGTIPDGFGLDNLDLFVTGLQLVTSLLPQNGTKLYWNQEGEKVATVLEVTSPIISLLE